MLDEKALGDAIDGGYRVRGDQLFRMERLPLYDVPTQNAHREAFLAGTTPDWTAKQAWLDTLADDSRRGLVSRRVRVFSADLTDDELMSCHFGYPSNGRYEDIRVLHHGEHPVPDLLDHDYWIVEPTDGDRQVLRMRYSGGGAFIGAEVLPATDHAPYLTERDQAWAAAEPFTTWWSRHPELHREVSAAP